MKALWCANLLIYCHGLLATVRYYIYHSQQVYHTNRQSDLLRGLPSLPSTSHQDINCRAATTRNSKGKRLCYSLSLVCESVTQTELCQNYMEEIRNYQRLADRIGTYSCRRCELRRAVEEQFSHCVALPLLRRTPYSTTKPTILILAEGRKLFGDCTLVPKRQFSIPHNLLIR